MKKQINSFLSNEIILLLLLLTIIGSSLCTGYYNGYSNALQQRIVPTDFLDMLSGVHFLVSIALSICLLGVYLDSLVGQKICIVSIFTIFGIYSWWYLEKYNFLKNLGFSQDAPEYKQKLEQIGIFRGAIIWDYFVLGFLIFLFLWVILKVIRQRDKIYSH